MHRPACIACNGPTLQGILVQLFNSDVRDDCYIINRHQWPHAAQRVRRPHQCRRRPRSVAAQGITNRTGTAHRALPLALRAWRRRYVIGARKVFDVVSEKAQGGRRRRACVQVVGVELHT
ncbi:hypothetical protein Cni_G14759 [Canna indica]|uniref:Uncharacterized protein n=1 Tax=Canna indica TaxID=4628 RepID=A0AAQ3KCN6_9LILI|nr:hypothetical protein Cni_G14759 [Canna indica]